MTKWGKSIRVDVPARSTGNIWCGSSLTVPVPMPTSFSERTLRRKRFTQLLRYGTWWISHWKLLWTKETVCQRNSISPRREWQPDATRSCEDGRPAPSMTLLHQRCKERSCERMCCVQYSHVFSMFSWETLNTLDFSMMQNCPVILNTPVIENLPVMKFYLCLPVYLCQPARLSVKLKIYLCYFVVHNLFHFSG